MVNTKCFSVYALTCHRWYPSKVVKLLPTTKETFMAFVSLKCPWGKFTGDL